MLLSIDKCLAAWLPAMRFALGPRQALKAQNIMRPIIERAQSAEDEKRISDMQPLIANCNPTADIKAGWYRMEIRYHPIEDGKKQPARSWIATILKPEEDDDEPSSPETRKAIQS